MKKKLESNLISIAHRILKLKGKEDINALQQEVKVLYERLTILKFVEEHFGQAQPTIGKSDVVTKFEEIAQQVISGNKDVPENNPHEEDIVVPLMDTINEMVIEMPETETLDDILSEILPEPVFEKKSEETLVQDSHTRKEVHVDSKLISLNDKLKPGIHVGLNDRIAFVKHLFDGSDVDYNRVLSQLNTLRTYDEAVSFLSDMVKPDYNHWAGKEEYESRFLTIIEHKFN